MQQITLTSPCCLSMLFLFYFPIADGHSTWPSVSKAVGESTEICCLFYLLTQQDELNAFYRLQYCITSFICLFLHIQIRTMPFLSIRTNACSITMVYYGLINFKTKEKSQPGAGMITTETNVFCRYSIMLNVNSYIHQDVLVSHHRAVLHHPAANHFPINSNPLLCFAVQKFRNTLIHKMLI